MDDKQFELVQESIKQVVTLVNDKHTEYMQTLAEERKKFEEMEKLKADGKEFGEVKEALERVEKAHSALEEQLQKEFAELKTSASSASAKSNDEEIKASYYEYLRTGGTDTLSEKQQDALAQVLYDHQLKCGVSGIRNADQVKNMLAGSLPNGGTLVIPPVIASGILRELEEEAAIYRLMSKTDISTDRYLRNAQLSKATAAWEGEMDTWPDTKTPTYGDLEIRVFKITARPMVSADVLEDAFVNLEAEITNSVRATFTDEIAKAAVVGNGNKKPVGLLAHPIEPNNPETRYFGKLGSVKTGTAGGFDANAPADVLIDVQGALKTGYLNNATWLMNRKTATLIRKMKDKDGNYLWEPSFVKGVPGSILGYPVAYDSNMPNVESNGYAIAFGDFARGMLAVRRRGMTMIRDVVTKPGQVIINTSMRIGIGVQDFDAIKLVKFDA